MTTRKPELNVFERLDGSTCTPLAGTAAEPESIRLDDEDAIERKVVAPIGNLSDGFVVAWCLDGVSVILARDFDGLPEGLLELRAFDTASELHAVCSESVIRGRWRTDGAGADGDADGNSGCEVLDECHLLWGRAHIDAQTGSVILSSDRGTRIELPSEAVPGIGNGDRALLRVRNYVHQGDSTALSFDDYRFVGFETREAK